MKGREGQAKPLYIRSRGETGWISDVASEKRAAGSSLQGVLEEDEFARIDGWRERSCSGTL
jgi:hypothetical protein